VNINVYPAKNRTLANLCVGEALKVGSDIFIKIGLSKVLRLEPAQLMHPAEITFFHESEVSGLVGEDFHGQITLTFSPKVSGP
jgi:hypothetical protein